MCNNSVLALILLIIIVFLLCKMKKNSKNLNENLVFDNLHKPNLSIENKTQYFYINLLKNLKHNENKKVIKLKSPCKVEKYIHNTTDETLKESLDNINSFILENLNKGHQYKFKRTNFGNIVIQKDKKDVINYIYEVFVQDVKNLLMIELKVNVIVFPDKNIKRHFANDITTCTEITTSSFPVYNIGIPSTDQYIPLPTQVIPTAGDVLSNKGVKYPHALKPKYLYVNELKILNSTLVVNPNTKCLSNAVDGKEDKSPEFSWFKNGKNPYIEKSSKRNRWPTLKDQPENKGQWPCTPVNQKWNTDGVYIPKPEPSKLCPGTTWMTKDMALQAQFWPTLATVPRNSGENAWLFEMSRGIPDFPTGSSV